jgi:hypothetical protein
LLTKHPNFVQMKILWKYQPCQLTDPALWCMANVTESVITDMVWTYDQPKEDLLWFMQHIKVIPCSWNNEPRPWCSSVHTVKVSVRKMEVWLVKHPSLRSTNKICATGHWTYHINNLTKLQYKTYIFHYEWTSYHRHLLNLKSVLLIRNLSHLPAIQNARYDFSLFRPIINYTRRNSHRIAFLTISRHMSCKELLLHLLETPCQSHTKYMFSEGVT